jgi:hypothetical protein
MAHRSLSGFLLLACLAFASPATAGPWGPPRFYLAAPRYIEDEPITFKLRHDNHNKVRYMSETWDIVDDSGAVISQYYWTADERRMAPHAYKTWVWDQHEACYGACQNVWEGDPAPPGTYQIRASVDDIEVTMEFTIGAYFHIGFDGRPKTDFVVFTHKADVVQQMRAELDRPQEERQIVAGKVRGRHPGYNEPWSFVLAPPSIFLGEVFVEVCDGSPNYVERHLNEWRGRQWCPWSSYVAAEGL